MLIVLFIGSQMASTLVMSVTADKTQQRIMLLLPLVFAAFIPNFPAGLIIYWITTNFWTLGQQLVVRRLSPPPPAVIPAARRRRSPWRMEARRRRRSLLHRHAGRRSAGGDASMADRPDSSGSADMPQRSAGAEQEARAEAEGSSVGAAKWAAMKELERRHPGITVDQVEFEVVEEGAGEDDDARVAATADLSAWRESEREFHWPDEPTERVREVLKRLIAHLGLRGSVDVVEHEEEILPTSAGRSWAS